MMRAGLFVLLLGLAGAVASGVAFQFYQPPGDFGYGWGLVLYMFMMSSLTFVFGVIAIVGLLLILLGGALRCWRNTRYRWYGVLGYGVLAIALFVLPFAGLELHKAMESRPKPATVEEVESARAVTEQTVIIITYAQWLLANCQDSHQVNPSLVRVRTMYAQAKPGFDQDYFDAEIEHQEQVLSEFKAENGGCQKAASFLPIGTVTKR